MIFRFAAIFAIFLLLLPFAEATNSSVNPIISNAEQAISIANMSAYLIFAPNLTSSYSYLNEAIISNNSSKASFLAMQAINSAISEVHKVDSYRATSIVIIGLFAIALFALLYVYSKPIKHNAIRRPKS